VLLLINSILVDSVIDQIIFNAIMHYIHPIFCLLESQVYLRDKFYASSGFLVGYFKLIFAVYELHMNCICSLCIFTGVMKLIGIHSLCTAATHYIQQ